jgi:HSP20 family molecular chaperone IbpA
MAEKARVRVLPAACVYHDKKKYTIELELAGVDKKDIEFQLTPTSFCMKAPRNGVEYSGCQILAHEVKSRQGERCLRKQQNDNN